MKIGIDYRSALVNREGIGRYTRELVRAIVELGHGAELKLFGYTLAEARFDTIELGLEGSDAQLCRLRLPSKPLAMLMRGLRRGADDLVGGCDVYHHTQPNLFPVSRASEVATIFDCIYTLDAGYLEPEAARRMTQVAFRQVARAKHILVPSLYVGAEVVMTLGAKPERVSVTPLGCDHVLRHLPPEGFPPAKEPYLLTVSRVDPRKNHLRILQAFELLVKEGLPHRWIIAGPRGWGVEPFEKALADSPASDRIEWRREVGESELTRLYAQADVFVFPSLNEGFGLPPIEAMACGSPVVTSCVTATVEMCEDAALLVEPTEPEEIFESTRRVLTEPELAEELCRRGHERAAELTWKECARRTLAAYRGHLTPRGAHPSPD